MRVGIVTREWPPDVYGGAGVHVEHLVAAMRALDSGPELDVHCFGDPRADATGHGVPSGLQAANGALQAFTMAAAIELPRGIRINTVSPTVLVEATSHHSAFPGFTQVSAAAVGQAYVKAVEGAQTGQVYALDGQ